MLKRLFVKITLCSARTHIPRHYLRMFYTKYVSCSGLLALLRPPMLNQLQLIRDGNHSVADLKFMGKGILGRRHVLPSVVGTLAQLNVEGTFPTGTGLVTVYNPISSDDGDIEKALFGSFLPIPSYNLFPMPDAAEYDAKKQPGAVVPVKEGRIILNEGRKRTRVKVINRGDRPVNVGHVNRGDHKRLTVVGDRSARTMFLSRPTQHWISTESRLTGINWTFPLACLPGLSQVRVKR